MTLCLPEEYELTDDQNRIDPVAAHSYLTHSYWSPGISPEKVRRAIANALCVAVFHDGAQVAMARVVTDYAAFAYLADVYVLDEHQGKRLAQMMIEHLQSHPDLQGLRRWILFTGDAHSLYTKSGWKLLEHPERAMELDFPDAFQ